MHRHSGDARGWRARRLPEVSLHGGEALYFVPGAPAGNRRQQTGDLVPKEKDSARPGGRSASSWARTVSSLKGKGEAPNTP
ncbi:hypothetical protein San01_09270 [Streptomyces angustmyceticus]|uniref:Uncharacterized protein n=1 Tax=Streptomyces angustmyceticus TaxID=285578 RepID=A0A5J4LAD8_9ACTN|nr:hypothetical protein San01_09270 [Streptomyces angustmyceticus]